jgi:radical SAM-linked protein
MDEEELLQAAKILYQEGWNLIKLYFMIGLPTETEEDVKEIVHLARRVLHQGRGSRRPSRLNVSVSTFVPKPHTPFQWEPQLTPRETGLRQDLLRNGLNRGRIRFKWHDPRMSLLEGVFSRGDRRLSRVLSDAFKMGCRFDGWSESLDWGLWCKAFEKNGIDMAFYTRRRAFSEILPWDHIQSGVTETFLKNEWRQSRQETGTHACQKACRTCGVCDGETTHVVSCQRADTPSEPLRQPPPMIRETTKLLVEFQKIGPARFLGHLDMARAFHRAVRRAGISLRYSEGFHPAPRVRVRGALPLGLESLCEPMEWELENPIDDQRLPESVNGHLPSGLHIMGVYPVSPRHRLMDADEERDRYLVGFHDGGPEGLEMRIQEFLDRDQWVVPGDGKKGGFDVCLHIETRTLVDPDHLGEPVRHVWSDLIHDDVGLMEIVCLRREGGGIRVDRTLGSIFSLTEEKRRQMRILRVGKAAFYGS